MICLCVSYGSLQKTEFFSSYATTANSCINTEWTGLVQRHLYVHIRNKQNYFNTQTFTSIYLQLWFRCILVFAESKLYWCDAKKDTIETSDFFGRNRKILKRFSNADTHLFGIDVYEGGYYIFTNYFDKCRQKKSLSIPMCFDLQNSDESSSCHSII